MSIADKLTYLNETKSLLREAINAAGGNLTQETPFREYVEGWLRDQSASLSLGFSKQQYVAKDKGTMFPDRVGFEDIVTFTRSTGGGCFNAQGQYEWLGPDEPRIDYDPLTGECLGLLVQEQRTNLLLWSEDLTNATWGKFDSDFWEFSVSTKPSPIDGVNFSRFFVPQEVINETSLYNQKLSTTVGTDYVLSFIVAKDYNLLRYCQIEGMLSTRSVFDIDTGTFANTHPEHTTGVINMGDSWRVWVAFTATATSARVGVMPQEVGNPGYNKDFTAGGHQYTTGFQFEEGSTPSSYISTEGAQVTRAADNATVNDLAPWYSPNQGSFTIKAKGHIGEPLLAAGDAFIIADSDELKEYQVSYSEDPQATQVDIGKGLIESIRYWPRETV